jgi:hypothetical protein
MFQSVCKCGKVIARLSPEPVRCSCGSFVQNPSTKLDAIHFRDHFHKSITICNQCEHQSKKGCGSGCSFDPVKPCETPKRLLKGAGCLHPTEPRFTPANPIEWLGWKQQPIGSVAAVTSLSLHPDAITRQGQAIQSWVDMGLRVVCVQRESEIDHLRWNYQHGIEWINNDDVGSFYTKPTQPIKRLAMVAAEIGCAVLVINSDIVLAGDQRTIAEPIEQGKHVSVIRWDYTNDIDKATRQSHGIDAFSFTPEQAMSLPDSPLSIGRPFWDYWIPYHARLNDWPSHFIGERFAFHEMHGQRWSMEDWSRGREWVCEEYGESKEFMQEGFRPTLPYPPSKKMGESPTILFDHFAKCAGSTIRDWLKLNFKKEEFRHLMDQMPETHRDAFKKLPKRERYRMGAVVSHGGLDLLEHLKPDTKVITTVRHPVDRAISFYFYSRIQTLAGGHEDSLSMGLVDWWRKYKTKFGFTSYFGDLNAMKDHYEIIGDSADIKGFCDELQKRFGLPVAYEPRFTNANPHDDPPPSEIKGLVQLLAEDIEFYEEIRKLPNYITPNRTSTRKSG